MNWYRLVTPLFSMTNCRRALSKFTYDDQYIELKLRR